MPRQVPKTGDFFLVPLTDGTNALGPVLETRPILMNSITCAFFDVQVGANDAPIVIENSDRSHVLACQFVTRDAFLQGRWPRVLRRGPIFEGNNLPYRETEVRGWIGAKVIGSGIVMSFLNAYFSMGDWHEMKDPKYYEHLLFDARVGPAPA